MPSIGLGIDFPDTVEVGKTYPASVQLTATGDNLTEGGNAVRPLQAGSNNYIGICNSPDDVVLGTPPGECLNDEIGSPWNQGILLTPSCSQPGPPISTPICDLAAADPGVFALSPTATGSGHCAGTTFDVTPFDAARGTVKLALRTTPLTPRVWLGQAGSFCRISFTITVVKLPVDASPGSIGAQTRSIASAGGGYNASELGTDHIKPAPLRASGADVTTLTPTIIEEFCPPPNQTIRIPPGRTAAEVCPRTVEEFCPPPNQTIRIPPGRTAAQVCPRTVEEFCPPPNQTIRIPPGRTAAEVCPREVDLMGASVAGTPRCVGGPKSLFAPKVVKRGMTRSPFFVTVTVRGKAEHVVHVQFRRNGRLIKTLTKDNGATGEYRLKVDPRKLVSSRRNGDRKYAITTRVTVKPKGTFTQSDPTDLVENLRAVRFTAVRSCRPPKPPG